VKRNDHISYPNGNAVNYIYYTSGASNERLQTSTNPGLVSDQFNTPEYVGGNGWGSVLPPVSKIRCNFHDLTRGRRAGGVSGAPG